MPPIRLATLASASPAWVRSATMTCAPSRASTPAMAAPMPRAAPVTSAVLPASGWSQSFGAGAVPGAEQQRLPVDVGRLAGEEEAQRRRQRRLVGDPEQVRGRAAAQLLGQRADDAVERLPGGVGGDVGAVGRAGRARAPGRTAPSALTPGARNSRSAGEVGRARRPTRASSDDRGDLVAVAERRRATSTPAAVSSRVSAAVGLAGGRAEQRRAGQQRVAGASSGAARPAAAARRAAATAEPTGELTRFR